jgi:hypothetical protein
MALRPKALALLARLALAGDRQDRDMLAWMLFGDAARPRDSLRWHLSYLRAQVPGWVVSDRTTASCRALTDVALFREGAKQIVSGTWPQDPAGTLALYRGALCAGLKVSASADFDNWLLARQRASHPGRARLWRLRRAVHQHRRGTRAGCPGESGRLARARISDKPPSGYGVDDHVRDLLELITVLGLDKPILLGHSLGGSIATFAAEAAGDRIGGLILHDAFVGDRAFTQGASFVVESIGHLLEQRFTNFDSYHAQWETEPDDSRWKQWIVRSGRMSLAPLPDGTFRRRSLRQALVEE